MSGRRHLSDEEQALWSGFVRSITPLRGSKKSASSVAGESKSAPGPVKTRTSVRQSNPPPKLSPQQPLPPQPAPLAPLGRRLKQRVARGHEPIGARIDLHGFTQSQAHVALLRFLQRAQTDGHMMVLVVTGKGTGSGGPLGERGVLRRQVPLWLGLPEFRSYVIGFEVAHVGHGGEGALYVRLRRRETRR